MGARNLYGGFKIMSEHKLFQRLGRLLLLFLGLILLVSGCDKHEKKTNGQTNSKISESYYNSQNRLKKIHSIDSLTFMADRESELMTDQLSDSLLAVFYQQTGLLFYFKSAYEQASDYFIKSEHYFKKADMHGKAAGMLSNQAVLQELQGNYQEAINMYLESATYFSDAFDSLSLAKVYTNIAVVYQEMGFPDKSLSYNMMGLKIRKHKQDTLASATNLNNIGVLYDELYHQPDSALHYYQQAVTIYRRYNKLDKWGYALNNTARIHIEQKNNLLASKELTLAYALMDSIDNPDGKAKVLRNQGELSFAAMNNQNAMEAFKQAFLFFKKAKDKKSMLEVSELLSNIYLAGGNYHEATAYMEIRNQIKDSLMSAESKSIIAEMETRYQVREKNKAISLLELQDELNRRMIRHQVWLITLLGVIFLLILLVFLFNFNRNKLKQQQLRLELQNYLLQIKKMEIKINENKTSQITTTIETEFEEFDLTEREKEVLQMISRGYKNSEIAEKLFVSENTVKTHIKNIYIKLDVKNRVEALKRVKMVQ